MNEKGNDIWRDADGCYAALSAHDARYDGRFFVGVSSTGIYCRPVCRVRTPKRANCTFYPSPATAEAAGFRPCLRCRPELAPGQGPLASGSRMAVLLAQRLEALDNGSHDIEQCAVELNTSSRHLRRVFKECYGVSPNQYRQTNRLLAAKALLADTELSVTEVAYASGFASLRAFHTAFNRRYGLSPNRLRRLSGTHDRGDGVTVSLGYRPPFDWCYLLEFFRDRAISGVEMVEGDVYRRTLTLGDGSQNRKGWLEVAHCREENMLNIRVSSSLVIYLPRLLALVRHVFDLQSIPDQIEERIRGVSRAIGFTRIPDIRLPGCFDGFEMAVRAILGQQVTVSGARTLVSRVVKKLGEPLETPWPELYRCFPSINDFLTLEGCVEDQLGPLGITRMRSRSIHVLAKGLESGNIRLARGEDPVHLRQKLIAVPGIGEWTADYLLMRVLSWPDVFLVKDAGVKKALSLLDENTRSRIEQSWTHWRSYLTLLLWRSLTLERSE